MFKFPIILDDESSKPLYAQLYDAIAAAIASGQLKPGEQIPSTRLLASKLGVARQTVLQCLEQLRNDGHLIQDSESKLLVARLPEASQPQNSNGESAQTQEQQHLDPPLSEFADRLIETSDVKLLPVMWRGILPQNLPVQQWRKALIKQIKERESMFVENVRDPLGCIELREALAQYVARTRSLECDASRVVVFTGTPAAVEAVARLVLNPGDWVAIENPGYRLARRTLLLHAAGLWPVAVDDEGMQVSDLSAAMQPIKLVYVTPAHHDPTGAVMPPARRLELLQWAKEHNAFVIEDDFDHFYRYNTRPVPSITALDKSQSTIYLSTFWQALFPMVRMGFAIFPRRLMPYVASYKAQLEPDLPVLEQLALADLLNQGQFEKHVKRIAVVYTRARTALVQALTRAFGAKVWVPRESAGMHLLVRFRTDIADATLLQQAEQAGFPVISTASHYLGAAPAGEFLIPFAFVEEESMLEAVKNFALSLGVTERR